MTTALFLSENCGTGSMIYSCLKLPFEEDLFAISFVVISVFMHMSPSLFVDFGTMTT